MHASCSRGAGSQLAWGSPTACPTLSLPAPTGNCLPARSTPHLPPALHPPAAGDDPAVTLEQACSQVVAGQNYQVVATLVCPAPTTSSLQVGATCRKGKHCATPWACVAWWVLQVAQASFAAAAGGSAQLAQAT